MSGREVERVIRNDETAKRCHTLGAIGEELAEQLLAKNGFSNIKNLNLAKKNYAFADFYAERDGQEYVISVKARNKYEAQGKLNSRYKLGAKCHQHAEAATEQFPGSTAAWLTISIEEKTFSAYFGLLRSLNRSTGVVMTATAIANYECLALDQVHGYRYDAIRNVYQAK